jgi:hypothetical protein
MVAAVSIGRTRIIWRSYGVAATVKKACCPKHEIELSAMKPASATTNLRDHGADDGRKGIRTLPPSQASPVPPFGPLLFLLLILILLMIVCSTALPYLADQDDDHEKTLEPP